MALGLMASLQPAWSMVRTQTDANGMITAVYGGERRAYMRGEDGSYKYFNQRYSQSGAVYAVVDGNDWYLKNILAYPATDGWVKGTLSADGSVLTVPAGQLVKSEATSDPSINWTLNIGDYDQVHDTWIKNDDDITYTVDGNYLYLDDVELIEDAFGEVSYDKILGVFFTIEDCDFANYGEWGTSLALIEDYIAPTTTLVTPPASADTETWYMSCKKGSEPIKQQISVAFDGSDVYMQGMLQDFPEAWIKGSISEGVATFTRMQYLGELGGRSHWAVSAKSDGIGITDFRMNYDAASKAFTGVNSLYENMSDVAINYTSRFSSYKVTAEEVSELMGLETPYSIAITNNTHLRSLTVIDANNDYETWKWNATKRKVRYEGSFDQDADDWMVTPAIQIYAGKTYRVSMDVYAESYDYTGETTHRIELMAGTKPEADELTLSVIPEYIFEVNDYNVHTLTGTITVSKTADMYFGIHALSEAGNYNLYANNLKIVEVPFSLNQSGYATYSAAADVKITTPGITAYKAAVTDDAIVLTALDGYIPAGTGVLLYGEELEGSSFSVATPSATDVAADVTGNELKATSLANGSLAVMPGSNVYALGDENEFLHYTGTTFVHNRAYLVYSGSASRLSVVFDDEATAISHVAADNEAASAISYDLQGRQLLQQTKGLLIRNNKVILVK